MGITFDCSPLVGSPRQDSWLCAQNGELTLALELAFLSILETDMGDAHARASAVREPPVDLGVQRTQLDLPQSFKAQLKSLEHCQGGQGN